jgi:hypothetical protein
MDKKRQTKARDVIQSAGRMLCGEFARIEGSFLHPSPGDLSIASQRPEDALAISLDRFATRKSYHTPRAASRGFAGKIPEGLVI